MLGSDSSPLATHADSCLWVPLARLSLHEVQLPPMPSHRLRAALAGALEEQLLDDPAELHFALAPDAQAAMKAGRAFEVMVCNKTWLQAELAKQVAQGRQITAIVPRHEVDGQSQGLGDARLSGRSFEHWNLAQFDLQAQARWMQGLQRAGQQVWRDPAWRWVRIGCVCVVVVQVLGLNVWAWRDRMQLAQKQAQIQRLVQETYPQLTVIVDAQAQMARALAQAKAQRGGDDHTGFEAQLASKAIAGKAYSQIEYTNRELKLTELSGSLASGESRPSTNAAVPPEPVNAPPGWVRPGAAAAIAATPSLPAMPVTSAIPAPSSSVTPVTPVVPLMPAPPPEQPGSRKGAP